MRRLLIIASIVLITTFSVGTGCVYLFHDFFLPANEVTSIEDSDETVVEREPEWKRDPLINQTWPLYINYDCDFRDQSVVQAKFTLTNVSSEPAFFDLDSKTGKLPSLLSNAFPWSKDVLSGIETDRLSPGESTRIYVPVPHDARFFHLSFGVSSGKPDRVRTVSWNLYSDDSARTCTELF